MTRKKKTKLLRKLVLGIFLVLREKVEGQRIEQVARPSVAIAGTGVVQNLVVPRLSPKGERPLG